MNVVLTRALFDTNILLDAYLQRQPWQVEAKHILDAHLNWQFTGYVSASSVTDIYYILGKQIDHPAALEIVREIVDSFAICEVDKDLLSTAGSMTGLDFEDNVQIACAIKYNLDAIVTRDATGFKHSSIPILSPAEFLARLKPRLK